MKKIAIGILAVAAVVLVAAWAWPQDDTGVSGKPVFSDAWTMCVRGEAQLTGGQAVVTLPAWFEPESLTGNRTVQLTCKDGWSPLWSSAVQDGRFTVSTKSEGNQTQAFYWQVMSKSKAE